MDREGRRCYFIFVSAIFDVVTPVLQDRLDNECKKYGNGTLQAFLNRSAVKHAMFHLHYGGVRCCVDKPNCTIIQVLPLNSKQWDSLYAENPGLGAHHCHCKYTATPIHLEDLDLSLAVLILVNCCTLTRAEEKAIYQLRQFRNYFAHNTDGTIAKADFDRYWPILTAYVLQLDNSKQDDLRMILNRPLDESLCNKYATQILDVHQRLDELTSSVDGLKVMTEEAHKLLRGLTTKAEENNALTLENQNLLQRLSRSSEENTTFIQATSNIQTGLNMLTTETKAIAHETKQNKNMKLDEEKGLRHQSSQELDPPQSEVKSKPYLLGQCIFNLYQQTKLNLWEFTSDGVMMDDGRLVFCLPMARQLQICSIDGSKIHHIPVEDLPMAITAVNSLTVAVTLLRSDCIEMYNIDNKQKLKSISVPGMSTRGITTIKEKLVVSSDHCLFIIDYLTEEKIQTINTGDCELLHSSDYRIFYIGDEHCDNNLYCYNYSKNKVTSITLPSIAWRITSLQDGSLYVFCLDGSLQHVSSNGKHYKPVITKELKQLKGCDVISYNPKQRKLLAYNCVQKFIKFPFNVHSISIFNQL